MLYQIIWTNDGVIEHRTQIQADSPLRALSILESRAPFRTADAVEVRVEKVAGA